MTTPAPQSGPLATGPLAPLVEWLALGRAALAAGLASGVADARVFEAQALQAEALLARRTELVAALARAPAPRVPAALAAELRALELELSQRLGAALEALRAELDSVRERQRAHAGYRPARSGAPAFVSRQV